MPSSSDRRRSGSPARRRPCRSSRRSGTLVAVSRPVGGRLSITRPSPDLFGLTDATSNVGIGAAGDVCALTRGASVTLMVTASATLVSAAVIGTDFFIVSGGACRFDVRCGPLVRWANPMPDTDLARDPNPADVASDPGGGVVPASGSGISAVHQRTPASRRFDTRNGAVCSLSSPSAGRSNRSRGHQVSPAADSASTPIAPAEP